MSTDRELLEQAAKAARIEIDFHDSGSAWHWDEDYTRHVIWNPLADDGDALRLAVELELHIRYVEDDYGQLVVADHIFGSLSEGVDADKLTATRRVIVRAAAKFGG